jgi:hypothetical protein
MVCDVRFFTITANLNICMIKPSKATQFRVDKHDNRYTILSQIYLFFLTSHPSIVDS